MTLDATQVAGRARLAVKGESVTLYDADGNARTGITAIVNRQPQRFAQQPRGPQGPMEVELLNDVTYGVSGSEWNHRWEIALSEVVGAAPVRKRLLRIVAQSVGLLVFEVG